MGSNDYCVFKEKAKVIPKECTAAQKMLYTAMCKADDRFTGEAVFQYVSSMCASDNPDDQESTDGELMVELNKESVDIAATWKELTDLFR